MIYRKFFADRLFTGREMIGEPVVLVTDEAGVVQDITGPAEAGEAERLSGTLCPGFINCHCHLELSHMRGEVPEGTGMVGFLLAVMGARGSSPEGIRRAAADAEREMAGNGIVAVGDICNTDHTLELKRAGRLYYHSFIEVMGFDGNTAVTRFKEAVALYRRFANDPLPDGGLPATAASRAGSVQPTGPALQGFLSSASVSPHSPYSVSPGLFALLNDHETGSLITMHNQESSGENEFFLRGEGPFLRLFSTLGIDTAGFRPSGRSSLQTCLKYISQDHSLILVHNVYTGRTELEEIRAAGASLPALYWCVCPNANLYITGSLPDIGLLQEYGSKLVIGTDSLASNRQLSVLEELKTLHHHFPAVPLAELLRWATSQGAEALRINDRAGSFEKGKQPGVVLIRHPNTNSLRDAVAERLL